MDYCSSCRRHLNGALVCPGCGAYAPDIAPVTSGGLSLPARTTTEPAGDPADTAAPWEPTESRDSWFENRPGSTAALGAGANESPATDPSGDVEDVADPEGTPLAPEGRAARRRQRARWKKNQRRAVVATTVALIGGGLTFASMDRSSTDKAQAATAPELPRTNGGVEEPTTEYTLPESPGKHARGSSPAPTKSPETNSPREQSADAPPHVSRQQARPDTDTAPRTDAPAAPKPQPTSPSTGGSGSGQSDDTGSDAQTPTPAPPDDSGSDSGSGSGTTPSTPAPEETAPDQLCLLVVCLG
jgi:hypothetical protein